MAKIDFKTDLADERVDEYKKINNMTKLEGIEVLQESKDDITVTTVNVLNEKGSDMLSKDIGSYITIEVFDIKQYYDKLEENLIKVISDSISKLIKKTVNKENVSYLIIGLGNEYVTPDTLGPKVVKDIEVTRHYINLTKELLNDKKIPEISAILPGVMGNTGIETVEIVKAIVDKIKPDIIIALDSLASSSMKRIGNTIQLSNTGITPGSGVRNKRESINYKTLNVPVIAIGVPTVVELSTLVNESIDKISTSIEKELKDIKNSENILKLLNDETRYYLVNTLLYNENYILTPKEIDEILSITSKVISSSINLALKG